MAFLQEEIRNYTFKAMNGILSTGSRSTAPDNLTYYEEMTTSDTSVRPTSVLTELHLIPPAPTLADAKNAATANPSLILDLTLKLTPSPNNKAFFCASVYGDLSTRLKNFIMPQMIPRTDAGNIGRASIGYTAKLFQGDPNNGGTEIGTTIEQIGADVGWIFNYGAGAIVIASDFTAITDPNDVWVQAFQYIGKTGGSGTDDINVDDITIETFPGYSPMSTTGMYPYEVIRDYWFNGVTEGVDDPDDGGSWQGSTVANGVTQVVPNSRFMFNYNDSESNTAKWPVGVYSLYSTENLDTCGLKLTDGSTDYYANAGVLDSGLWKYDIALTDPNFIASYLILDTALTVPFNFMLIDKYNTTVDDEITIKHINSIIDANELSIDGSYMVSSDSSKELVTKRYVDSRLSSADEVTLTRVIDEPTIKITSDPLDLLHDAWDPTLPGSSGWTLGDNCTYDSSTGTITNNFDHTDANSQIIFESASAPYPKTYQAGIYRFLSSVDFDAIGLRMRIFVTESYHYSKELTTSGKYLYSIYSPKNITFQGLHMYGPTDAVVDIQFVDAKLYPPMTTFKIKEIDHIIDDDFESIDGSDTPMVDPHRELVTRAYVDSGRIKGYTQTFTQSDLVSGILLVQHNLNAKDKVTHITIKNNNKKHITPDDIIDNDENLASVNLSMIEPITGTWTVLVTCLSDSNIQEDDTKNKYINGGYINSSSIN